MKIDSEIIEKFNEKELRIYKYMLAHPIEFPYMSLRDIAKDNQCSTTVVLNFSKKCGFHSFKELKYEVKMNNRVSSKVHTQYDFDEVIYCLQKMTTDSYQERIHEAVDMIFEADQVVFMGVGNSGMIASYGARLFSSVGKFAVAINDAFLRVNAVFESTVFIVLSVSGQTDEMIRIVKECKRSGCSIIVITAKEYSPLARLGDIVIPYYLTRQNEDMVDLTSQMPAVSIIEQLARIYNK